MVERAYLDWNATAPLRPEARAAMAAACDLVGNPSSVHREGREARRLIEAAREEVAALVGAEPGDVIFTSGGTEANALALAPARGSGSRTERGEYLLVSAIEHPSVRGGGRFDPASIREVPVAPSGVVDLSALEALLAARAGGQGGMVSIMLANNESGIVQPIASAAEIVHRHGAVLHVDAVQGPGRIACDVKALGADLLTLSAHKLGGPKGTGALIRRGDRQHAIEPAIRGGGQERGMRPGTENVAGIAGFGAAARATRTGLAAEAARIRAARDRLEAGLRAISPTAIIFGSQSERLPNTTLFAVPGLKAETAVIGLDLAGVAVSSGAACSSGKVQASHVLAAMGVPAALAGGALRVSLGCETGESDVNRFLDAWLGFCGALDKRRQGIAA